ncbi:MAG TPA: DUF2332 domain-containing protein [Ilumatobacteraceae bacterium]|nr:DUF2332 domain-containing protein [Ilumatobacteraceae bacterium]
MPDPVVDSSLDAEMVRDFAAMATSSLPRAPLYAALSVGISRDPELYRLLLHAPPTQRLPVLLFACVHDLLLDDPHQELARWYPNLTSSPRPANDRSLMPTFKRFVEARADQLHTLLAKRTTQTNEVGRCAIFLPAFGLLADEVGPLGQLDVGASGGLNLLGDHYEYHYESHDGVVTTVGGTSSVVLRAETRGPVPIPPQMPVIAARCGIDQRPIDVTDDDEAHWLEACVWPDQPDRFHRLVAAIEIARQSPPEILAGDAVTSLAPAIERVGSTAHPVVTNSWVLNYLTSDARTAYLAELERIGAERDLSWVYAEAPALIPELPTGPDPADPHRTVLSMARWRNGERTVDHLATCHPHGFWIHWR